MATEVFTGEAELCREPAYKKHIVEEARMCERVFLACPLLRDCFAKNSDPPGFSFLLSDSAGLTVSSEHKYRAPHRP